MCWFKVVPFEVKPISFCFIITWFQFGYFKTPLLEAWSHGTICRIGCSYRTRCCVNRKGNACCQARVHWLLASLVTECKQKHGGCGQGSWLKGVCVSSQPDFHAHQTEWSTWQFCYSFYFPPIWLPHQMLSISVVSILWSIPKLEEVLFEAIEVAYGSGPL